MTRVRVLVMVVVLAASCKSPSKSPWRRKLAKADRAAWIAHCRIPPRDVEISLGTGADETDNYSGRSFEVEGPAGPLSVVCSLGWDRQLDRARYYHIAVDAILSAGGPRKALRAEEVAAYTELIVGEAPAAIEAVVRLVARGKRQEVRAGDFLITGGFDRDPAAWTLEIEVAR